MRRVDFGDRVTGRVVGDQDLRPTRPPRYVTGEVHALYPQARRIVGVLTDAGSVVTIRLPKGATT